MMSIRSLADFNGAPLGGAVTGWHRHRHRPGPTLRVDTTKEGWGLLPGHQRGPTPGHQRGLSHGHGHLDELTPNSNSPQPVATWRSRWLIAKYEGAMDTGPLSFD